VGAKLTKLWQTNQLLISKATNTLWEKRCGKPRRLTLRRRCPSGQ